MELRPIKTEEEHKMALSEIERLFDAAPDSPDGDRLDVPSLLVAAYEEQHHPIPPTDPVAALEPYLGSGARVAEVLNRRRALTIGMIRRLHRGLGIPAEVLIQSYPLTGPQIDTTPQRTEAAALSGG